MIDLSARLLRIAGMVKPGIVADIGADHAHLSIYLVQNKIASKAIVTEISSGPLSRAEAAVRNSGLTPFIEVRSGDGIKPLAQSEVDTVVIAGMGGKVINDIITADWIKSESFAHYILQPMTKPELVRQALASRGWPILAEDVVLEKGKWYSLMLCCPGRQPYNLSDLEMELGPHLLAADTPGKRCFLRHCRNRYDIIHENLLNSSRPENLELAGSYLAKKTKLGEILNEA